MRRFAWALAVLVAAALASTPAEAKHRSGRWCNYGYQQYPAYGYGYGYGYAYPAYGYPVYGFGVPGGGLYGGYAASDPFGGSPYGGNQWYWLTQQASQGHIPWSTVNQMMYGDR